MEWREGETSIEKQFSPMQQLHSELAVQIRGYTITALPEVADLKERRRWQVSRERAMCSTVPSLPNWCWGLRTHSVFGRLLAVKVGRAHYYQKLEIQKAP